MKLSKKITSSLLLPLLLSTAFVSSKAFADWTLNNDKSTLSFVSVKSSAIAEVHYFKQLSGSVDKSGKASVEVDLASPETMIPIRNDRLQSMLFQTELYSKAVVMANIDFAQLSKLAIGESFTQKQTVVLDLHGNKNELATELQITKLVNDAINVSSIKPIVLNAADFKLVEGINALRDIAGLPSITTQVPVTFNLVFDDVK
jgi:hypothetical protein